MKIMEDHVHLFLSAPPRYAPAEIVQIMKSISARVVFQEFPEVKDQLCGGELWNDGFLCDPPGIKVLQK